MSLSRLDSAVTKNIALFLKDNTNFSSQEKEKLATLSRIFWQRQIKTGTILFEGKQVKPSLKFDYSNFQDQKIFFNWKKIKRELLLTFNLNQISYPGTLSILNDSNDFLVLNKPAGLKVHQSSPIPFDRPRDVSLVEIIQANLRNKIQDERAGIAHRIDKETSGAIIVARNEIFHKFIKQKFSEKEVSKTYLALCQGDFPCDSFYITSLIGKKSKNPTLQGASSLEFKQTKIKNPQEIWTQCVKEMSGESQTNRSLINPKPSLTFGEKIASGSLKEIKKSLEKSKSDAHNIFLDWDKIARESNDFGQEEPFSLLKINLFSGRTHQIRVHLSEVGFPIVGDKVYGKNFTKLPCHFLHSFKLSFELMGGSYVKAKANHVSLWQLE